MKYVKLGSTGLDVSPICLGCMSYGVPDRGAPRWTLDEDAEPPFIQRAVEAGINFFDTANVVLRRHERGDRRAGSQRLRPPRRDRARHQGARRDAPRAPTAAACRARRS